MISPSDFELTLDRRTLVLGTVGGVVTAAVVYALYTFLGAVVFAVFAYYASRPVYRRLVRHTDYPDLAATATIVVYSLPVVLVLGYGLYVLGQQLQQLFAQGALQQYRSLVAPYLTVLDAGDPATWRGFFRDPTAVLDRATRRLLRRGIGPARAVLTTAASILAKGFLALVFVFYLLRDDRKIAEWARRVVDHDDAVVAYGAGVDERLETIFFGNLLTIVATGAIAIVVYWGLDWFAPAGGGIAVPFLLGAITGLGTLIPGVGMKLVYFPYTAYLLFEALRGGPTPLWFPVAFFVVTLVVVDTFPDYFVRSYLSAGDVALGLVMLAYILGTMVWGWTGLFLGPLLLAFFLQFARQVLPSIGARGFGD